MDILEQHATLFVRHGAREVIFCLDIYYEGGQCAFEIFGMAGLRRINKIVVGSDFELAFPVDINLMSEDKIKKWADELESQWDNCLLQR